MRPDRYRVTWKEDDGWHHNDFLSLRRALDWFDEQAGMWNNVQLTLILRNGEWVILCLA